MLALHVRPAAITKSQYDAARRTPLPSAEGVGLPGTSGPAKYFTEYVKQQLIDYYGSGKVFGGGLKVYTSINLDLQNRAREAIDKWLTRKDGPAAALVAVDPRDGQVLAMIGGEGFSKSQFNLATQGERQPGSSFKPFVLAAALAEGVSPETTYESKPQVINIGDKLWAVRNYENAYLGSANLTTATIYSDNTVYAQLTAQVGPKRVAQMAHKLGIQSPLDNFFAIGLGAEAVNPLEMARSFATFANSGRRIDGSVLGNLPRVVRAVQDGKDLLDNSPVARQVLDPNQNAILTSILHRSSRSELGSAPRSTTGRSRARREPRRTTVTPGSSGTRRSWPSRSGWGIPIGFAQCSTSTTAGPGRWRHVPGADLQDIHGEGPAPSGRRAGELLLRRRPYASPRNIVFRNGRWRADNGYCRGTREVLYFYGRGPGTTADCKPNEVEVPKVVGAKVLDAEARLAAQPLQYEVIYRPAKPGGGAPRNRPRAAAGRWNPRSVRNREADRREGPRGPRAEGGRADDRASTAAPRELGARNRDSGGRRGRCRRRTRAAAKTRFAASPNMIVRLLVGQA